MSEVPPSANRSLLKFTHEKSGRTYLLYERLTPREARAYGEKQKQLQVLVDKYDDSTIDTEIAEVLADIATVEAELWTILENTFQRCLGLSSEQILQIDYNEASSVFSKVIEFCVQTE